jgi:4a-hydroxytetrahydrobiopterin dehydratase
MVEDSATLGAMPEPLDAEQVADQLRANVHWRGDSSAILRSARLPDFRTAISAVDDIADAAEALDHHPDIDIRFNTLHFELSSHSVGGVTDLDFELARAIDIVLDGLGAQNID